MNIYVYDGSNRQWGAVLCEVAGRRSINAKFINHVHQIEADGYGFVRLNSHPITLPKGQMIYENMAEYLTMIQDTDQVNFYDNKRAQYRVWGNLMPDTWIFDTKIKALDFLFSEANFPLISKADVGASSKNVRLLRELEEAVDHVNSIFDRGLVVDHCSVPKAHSLQHDYVYFQTFLPNNNVTYRVNAVGNQRAIFIRHNYPDRPMAQTGNVEPTYSHECYEDLIYYADNIFKEINTKWCALDIIRDGEDWKLLETSLAWPWPSPGDCNNGIFFPCGKRWIEMFDVMLDEVEAGVWD